MTAKDLARKLGIKPEQRIAIVGAPEGYARSLEKMVPSVRLSKSLEGTLDFIQLFARSERELGGLSRALPGNLIGSMLDMIDR